MWSAECLAASRRRARSYLLKFRTILADEVGNGLWSEHIIFFFEEVRKERWLLFFAGTSRIDCGVPTAANFWNTWFRFSPRHEHFLRFGKESFCSGIDFLPA